MERAPSTRRINPRLALLLASTSFAALMVAGGAPSAWAACNVTQNGGTVALVGNSSASGNCILVENGANVTGSVANAGTGVLTAHGILSSRTGITINNSTVGGTVSNSGAINAIASGIRIENGAAVSNGITNSGAITTANSGVFSSSAGIFIGADRPSYNIANFAGSVSNSGTITAVTYNGIRVNGVENFAASIANSGTISAHGFGIVLGTASPVSVSIATFAGSISNSGTISGAHAAINASDISTFVGGIANTGTLLSDPGFGIALVVDTVSVFSGNVSNGGAISAGVTGIKVNLVGAFGRTNVGGVINSGTISVGTEGITTADIGTFVGGIFNTGTITAGANGIIVAAVSTFSGGINNASTISAGRNGIFVDGNPVAFSLSSTIGIENFHDGISNSGAISANGNGIFVGGTANGAANSIAISTFNGGITNAGTISVHGKGVFVGGTARSGGSVTIGTFLGGISNSGIISAAGTGIAVNTVSTFLGGISNTGTISGSAGIVVSTPSSVSIFDSGVIVGTGGTAVDLSGNAGGNAFTLGPGYNISGNVVGTGSDIFQLGGSGSGSFNLNSIGAGQQYRGFSTFEAAGGVWTVTGTSTPSWTITSGGTLLIGSNTTTLVVAVDDGTFGFAQSGAYTYGHVISGTGVVEQLGPGTTTLTGDNTYTGGTVINGGTLALAGTGSIAASSGVADNGTFDISGLTNGGTSIAALSGSGNVALGANTLTLTGAGGTFAGVIANGGLSGGSGGKFVLDGGTETLTGANSYSGGTALNGGTLVVGNTSALGSGTLAMAAGTTLSFLNADYTIANKITISGDPNFTPPAGTLQTLSGIIADGNSPGTLAMNGAGTLVLSAVNSYTGTTAINGGTVALAGTASIAASSGVVDNGTFDISGLTNGGTSIATLSGAGTVALGAKTLTLTDAGGTFAGAINGAGGLTITTGAETLTGTNGYTGATTINGSTLALAGTGSIAASSGVADNGIFDISRLTNGGTLIVTLSGNGIVALGANTLIFTNAGGVFAGAINGAGGLTLTTGIETLTGTNGYTGATTINGGTLALAGTGSIAASSGVANNGTFDISGLTNGDVSFAALSGSGTVALGANTLTLTGAGGTFAGLITDGGLSSGVGGKLVLDAGIETLTGANVYTGGTVLNNGTLVVGNNSALGSGALSMTTGTTLSFLNANYTITNKITISGDPNFTSPGGTVQTLSGIIADGASPGTLATSGAGTLVLTGANAYTGGTVINGGTLALAGTGSIATSSGVADNGTFDISGLTNGGASIATLSGNGNVALGANTLTLNADGTFAGVIADGGLSGGSGGKLVLDVGTETLTGANGYTGGTLLRSGTLVVGNNSALGSGTLSMAAGTTLSFLNANYAIANNIAVSGDPNFTPPVGTMQTLSGVIADGDVPGTLAMSGAGTLVLSGDNSYSGGTTIAAGTLTLSGAGTLGAATGATTINSGATLDLGGTTQTQAVVNLAGGTLQNGALNAEISATGGIINGIGGTAGVTVTAGTTIIEGVDGYTGATSVNGGTLDVIGSVTTTSALNVNSGAVLTGTGTIRSLNVNSGATFAPGIVGQPGTSMTIASSLAFTPGALYAVSVNPAASAFVNVGGTATLNGTVDANFVGGTPLNSKPYEILKSAGLNGAFSAVTATNLPAGFDLALSYGGNDAFLNLVAVLGAGTPLNSNQINVTTAINNYFNDGGTLPASFLPVFSLGGGNLTNALLQLNGEDATAAQSSAFGLMNQFFELLLDPSIDGRGSSSLNGGALGFAPDRQENLPDDFALAYARLLKAPPRPSLDQRWSVWGSAFGGSTDTNGDPGTGSNNVTTGTYGYAAGLDYRYSPDTVLGFSLAGGGTNWNLAQGLGTGRSDAFLAGAYGVTHEGPAYVAAALAFANNWFTTNRTAFAGDQLTASFEGQSYGARFEGGYRFAMPVDHNAFGVTPYAALQVQDFRTPAYSESDLTGGGFGLSYVPMSGTDARSELGARFEDLTSLANRPLILRTRLAWAHDWVGNPALNASFLSLPGTGFTVNGAPIPHNSALTSAGAQLFFMPSWSFIAKFDGAFASGSQTYAGSGTLRYTW